MRNHALAAWLLIVVGCHRSIVSASEDPAVASSDANAADAIAMGMADLTPAPASGHKVVVLPEDDTIPRDFRLSFDRSLCQGPCTQFAANIDAKGTITFTGVAYENQDFSRPINGCATKQIGTNGVVAIIAMLKKDNFPALRENYLGRGTEQQLESVSVSMNHTYQGVNHAVGSPGGQLDAAAIKSIQDIEGTLEQVTGATAFMAAPKSMPCKK